MQERQISNHSASNEQIGDWEIATIHKIFEMWFFFFFWRFEKIANSKTMEKFGEKPQTRWQSWTEWILKLKINRNEHWKNDKSPNCKKTRNILSHNEKTKQSFGKYGWTYQNKFFRRVMRMTHIWFSSSDKNNS